MAVVGEAQKEGTGGTGLDLLKAAYVACRACENALYYYTCMYVGLTLLRTPATANTGSPSHGKLKELVNAMGTVKRPLTIFQAELAAMRKMVNLPGEAAAPAEVEAEAAGSSKQTPTKTQQKPAEEPREVSGKRPMPSTQKPKKRAKSAGGGTRRR